VRAGFVTAWLRGFIFLVRLYLVGMTNRPVLTNIRRRETEKLQERLWRRIPQRLS
jgi:hypothetical protein